MAHFSRSAAALSVVALAIGSLGACTKASTGSSPTSSQPGSSSNSAQAAPSTIKIGVPIADTASLAKAGVSLPGAVTAAEEKLMYSSALKAVSGTAAAGGHQLEPDFDTFDLVQPGAPQKACLQLVKDNADKVVVADQFVNGGDQCVVQRGGFLIQNVAAPQAAYAMKSGEVFTTDLLPSTAAKNFAAYLSSSAGLKGKKVGVLTDALGGDSAPVKTILVPALKAAGADVVHVTTLTADLTQVAQQIPVEVAALKDAGVTTIIDATPSANLGQFLGGMRKVGWNVPFIASDLNNAVDETFAALYPPTFKATAITARRFADTTGAGATSCYKNYQAAGGKALAVGTTGYQVLMRACDTVTVLAAGLVKLGSTTFSNSAFAAALGNIGALNLRYYGPSALSGSSHTTVQATRVVMWSRGGWQPTSGGWRKIANG